MGRKRVIQKGMFVSCFLLTLRNCIGVEIVFFCVLVLYDF